MQAHEHVHQVEEDDSRRDATHRLAQAFARIEHDLRGATRHGYAGHLDDARLHFERARDALLRLLDEIRELARTQGSAPEADAR